MPIIQIQRITINGMHYIAIALLYSLFTNSINV